MTNGAPHVLYIGPHGVVGMRLRRRTWYVSGRFVAEGEVAAAQAAEFTTWLRGFPHDRFELIVDVLDEEQHADQLPKARGRDMALMIRRRLEQRFREAEFALATPLDATADRRRRGPSTEAPTAAPTAGVPMLLSAIRSPAALSPWVPKLRETERPVSSMVSPALLAARVAKRIAPHASGMLVSVAPGGLRQTVIVGGRLRFSRLAAAIDGSSLEAIRTELLRTAQYLQMAQTVPADTMRDGRFQLWLVTDGVADAARMPSTLTLDSGARMPVTPVSLAQLGAPALLAADGSPAALGALALWLDPKLRRPMGAGYASRSLRRFEILARVRRLLWGTGGAALAAAAMALAGVELLALGTYGDPQYVEQRRTRDLAEQHRLRAVIGAHPLPGSELEALVRTAGVLQRRQVDAPVLLRTVSAAMTDDPDLRLTEIAWSRAMPGAAGASAATASMSGQGLSGPGLSPVGMSPAGPPSAPGGMPMLPPPGSGLMPMPGAAAPGEPLAAPVDVVIRGTVAARRPKSEANALVQSLGDSLAARCDCTVEIRDWPYDRGPAVGWTEELKDGEAGRAVPFSLTLRLVEPPQPPEQVDVARR
jgi:hypothetical protein